MTMQRAPDGRDGGEPWELPVLLHVEVREGWTRHKPGSRVFLPAWTAIRLSRRGAATLLTPSIDMNTGRITDPLAPPPAPDPYRGAVW